MQNQVHDNDYVAFFFFVIPNLFRDLGFACENKEVK